MADALTRDMQSLGIEKIVRVAAGHGLQRDVFHVWLEGAPLAHVGVGYTYEEARSDALAKLPRKAA